MNDSSHLRATMSDFQPSYGEYCVQENTGYLLKLLQKSQETIIKERGKKEQGLENKHVQSVLPCPTGSHTPTLSYIPPPFLNAPLQKTENQSALLDLRALGKFTDTDANVII